MSSRLLSIVLSLGLTVPFFPQTTAASAVCESGAACVEKFGYCGQDLMAECCSGELDGAPYAIVLPDDWNGVLLVHGRGYYPTRNPANGDELPLRSARPARRTACSELLERGYALAGTSYSRNGVVIDIMMRDIHALTTHFNGLVGRPEITIVTGNSAGGLAATGLIEKFPGIYDAGISTCGALAGIDQLGDLYGAYRLAYHVAFGWPPDWGTFGDVEDDLIWGHVYPTWDDQYNDPNAHYFFEFMRLVYGYPSDQHYDTLPYGPEGTDESAMFYATHVIADAETYLGSATSFDYEYGLSADQIHYLEEKYEGFDPQLLLDEMNGLAEDADAPHVAIRNRQYMQSGRRTGHINRPLLSLAVIDDGTVGNYQETFYRDLVESAGKGDLLVNLFYEDPAPHPYYGPGHCDISGDAMAAGVAYVLDWLEAGDSPDVRSWRENPDDPDSPSFEDLGFDLDFEPPLWPLVPRDDE